MAEFMRNKGRSESSSAGSSAAGREGPRGAEPSAVRTSVAAVAGDTAAGREITLRGEASRNLGATGRREAAVPVEVAPARGQPDQPRRAANGMHSQEASPGAAQELRQQQQQQEASPGVAQRPQQRQQQQAHHARQAGRRNYSDRHTSSLCQVWSSSCSQVWSSSCSRPWSSCSRPWSSSS